MKLFCFVTPILEVPEVVGMIMGALELVDVVAGLSMKCRAIMIVITRYNANDIGVIRHHHTYITCRDAPSSIKGNKTGNVVHTMIEVEAQRWGVSVWDGG